LAERKQFRLERVLGDNALFASAYGNVGSSIYYALGLVAALALGLTPLVFVIAGALFVLTASTYTEATTMYPEAGGSASFARHAFNETVSFGAAWVQTMNFIVTAAISALFVPHYLGFVWEGLGEPPGDIVVGALVIIGLAWVNIRGVKEAARLNLMMAITDLLTQIGLVVAGIFLVLNFETLIDNVEFGVAPEWRDFLVGIPIAMIAYTGIETVSNMSEEAVDAPRTVPRAMRKVVLAVVIIYAAIPAIALSALPVTQEPSGEYVTKLGQSAEEGGYAADPVLGLVRAMDLGPFAGAAEVYVGLLAATILLLAANAGMFGVSRLLFSMGQYQQVPSQLSRLHNRYRTPYIGLALCSAVAALLLLGPASFLGNLYASFAMLSFTIAHVSVIVLRKRRPDMERPYRGPGNIRLRSGWTLPVFAVVGATGTSLAFIVVTALHPEVALIGFAWLAVGMGAYWAYRRHKGLELSHTRKVEIPDQVMADEVIYHSVLIVCDPAEDPGQSLYTARRLSDHPSHIRFLSLIPVSKGYPIDYPLESEEQSSRHNMRKARRVLGRRASIREMRCPRAGKATAIIREAQLVRAEAIVMPMPPVQRRISRDNLFGGTRLMLLDERPCRVLLVEPVTTRARFDIDACGPFAELPITNHEPDPTQSGKIKLRRRDDEPTEMMVCVFGDKLDDDVVQTACRLSRQSDKGLAKVHAVAVGRVPEERPIEQIDDDKRVRLTEALRRAEAVGEEYEGVDVIPHLYASRKVAETMVRVSIALEPEMVLLAADDAAAEEREAGAAGATNVGTVTQAMMRYARCRVVLTASANQESVDRLGRSRTDGNVGVEGGDQPSGAGPLELDPDFDAVAGSAGRYGGGEGPAVVDPDPGDGDGIGDAPGDLGRRTP
jgi:APA family basic amino acid/polyamine antiporter